MRLRALPAVALAAAALLSACQPTPRRDPPDVADVRRWMASEFTTEQLRTKLFYDVMTSFCGYSNPNRERIAEIIGLRAMADRQGDLAAQYIETAMLEIISAQQLKRVLAFNAPRTGPPPPVTREDSQAIHVLNVAVAAGFDRARGDLHDAARRKAAAMPAAAGLGCE